MATLLEAGFKKEEFNEEDINAINNLLRTNLEANKGLTGFGMLPGTLPSDFRN